MGKLELALDADQPPLFVGAGIITTEDDLKVYSAIPEFAAEVFGSFSINENRGVVTAFYYDEPTASAYNIKALANCGIQAASSFLPEGIKKVQADGRAAIISVTALKGENPKAVLPPLVEQALTLGADGVEINGSCPNENNEDVLCSDVAKSLEVVRLVRERVGLDPYLILKVSPLAQVRVERYKDERLAVDGISAVNSCRCLTPRNAQTGQRFIEINSGFAGRSGPIISGLARANLQFWKNKDETEPQYDLWSIGGVDNGFEAHDRVSNLGAFLVGGAQAFYRSDDPALLAKRWAAEYRQAEQEAA